MQKGTTFIGTKIIFKVPISDDRSGTGTTHEEYFFREEDAAFVSVLDGSGETPQSISVMEFSDGSLVASFDPIKISDGPAEEDRESLRQTIISKVSPVHQLILFGRGREEKES